ncbi:MAG: transketolase [Turneriella sp.]|nr:transketolase [Leptospiraceae bacterium]MCX7632648.1 transketolase [Turneriella sp.]
MDYIVGDEKEKAKLDAIRGKAPEEITEDDLRFLARRIRQNVIEMVFRAKSGHPGGPLGLADIYAYLYFKVLRWHGPNPDRFLLSNGHVCAVRYSAMALRGIISEAELATFRKLGSRLQGHPSTKFFPEAENSSGSLGQGLSNACGLALGLRLQKNPARVFVGMSDGECQEGMTWEAAMAAAHYAVTNLHPFVDCNNIQIDGYVHKVMAIEPLHKKFTAFGWEARVADGHNFSEIADAFHWSLKAKKRPRIILFRTVLGKGVSFMENNPDWHGSPPGQKERDQALAELAAIPV